MKMTTRLIILGLILLITSSVFAAGNEYYFKFEIKDFNELKLLTRVISIDNRVDGYTIYAYANDSQLADFQALGYDYELLPHPGTLIDPEMTANKDAMAWDTYPTYDVYKQMMEDYANNYPTLCLLDTIGYSENGRVLLVVKISDNVTSKEAEPEVFYTSSMHGDEITGYVLMLRLIDYFLTNYGSDSQVNNMVDNMEIWINPLANPDGTYYGGNNTVSGARRYNANGIDLNRNYPDPQDGPHSDGNSYQDETLAFMAFAEAHNFVLSANFHGGAEVFNYPWDTWSTLAADDAWWQYVGHRYADSCQANSPAGYMNGFDDGITNGYAWYTVNGGRQDYMNYWHHCREVTIEISDTKLIPASQLPAHWDYNRAALLEFLESALNGVNGIVTNAVTTMPIEALVEVVGHDLDSSQVRSTTLNGDYYRMLNGGTYSLRFSAPGYVPQTISGVTVINLSFTNLDVQLQPLPNEPILIFVSNNASSIDAGDTIDFNITLQNDGGGDATNASAVISSIDSYVIISQGSSGYPTIASIGGTGTSLVQYQIVIDETCPLLHVINFTLDFTADGGYVGSDQFSIVVGEQIEDFEKGNFSSYPWSFAGNANWVIATDQVYEGATSASSGNISHNQNSDLLVNLDVTSAGNISFWCKVSSESGYDYLQFYIDNNLKNQWSGEVGWVEVSYAVSAGNHTFKWIYDKDVNTSDGSDKAWVDYIVFPPTAVPLSIITASLPNWTVGHPYSYQLVATGGSGSKTWSDLNNDLFGTGLSLSTDGLLTGTAGSIGLKSFTAHVEDGGSSDNQPYSFIINPAVTVDTDSLPDWTAGVAYSQQLLATGGTGIKTWSDKNSDLSATGLTINSSGLLTGTVSSATSISFTALAVDNVGADDEQLLSFTINSAVNITTTSLPGAITGTAYSQQLLSSGGTGTIDWTDLNNDLSAFGLSVSTTGLVSGTPTASGTANFTAHAVDIPGSSDNQLLAINITDNFICGDADGSSAVDISDAVYLIAYIFAGGPAPAPSEAGDPDCSGGIDISDAVYLIAFIFAGGPAPCASCP